MADTMDGLRLAKKELRTLMRQKLSNLSIDSIEKQSSTAVQNLLTLPEYKTARRVGIYLSMPKGELVTDGAVRNALQHAKRVFVPYIHKLDALGPLKSHSAMNMVSLHSLSDYESLKPDGWGIPSVSEGSINERCQVLNAWPEGVEKPSREGPFNGETNIKTEKKDMEPLDVIVMPGVAFDKNLGRLGHGKGFYDHFLDCYHRSFRAPMPFLVGLCLDIQLLPDSQRVPTDTSDHNLDALVVGDGTIVRS